MWHDDRLDEQFIRTCAYENNTQCQNSLVIPAIFSCCTNLSVQYIVSWGEHANLLQVSAVLLYNFVLVTFPYSRMISYRIFAAQYFYR
jgi:hypothetical protein